MFVTEDTISFERGYPVCQVSISNPVPNNVQIQGNLATYTGEHDNFHIEGVKWYYNKTNETLQYINEDTNRAYKDLTNTSALSKLAKSLGYSKFVPSIRSQRKPKEVHTDSPVFKYLLSILDTCPSANVTAIESSVDTEAKLDERLKYYYSKQKRKDASGTFKYAYSVEQVRALSLLQSYTESFNSCQYYPVHLLTLSMAETVIEGGLDILDTLIYNEDTDEYLTTTSDCRDDVVAHKDFDTYLFKYEQDTELAFNIRYFTQNTDGTVKSRFTIFPMESGAIVANNFYNMTPANILADDITAYSKYDRNDSPKDTTVYFNL